MEPVNIFDFERLARERLSPMAWDYYASGAHDEITVADNHEAFRRIRLAYRVLMDVSRRSTATTVSGHDIDLPVLVAPTAFHRLAHDDGEAATARAAGRAGTIMVLSTLSNVPVEDVVRSATGPVWFQLYVYRDRGATEALVRRVEAAGAEALMLTVDAPLLGTRERDVRNRFHLPDDLSVANLLPEGRGYGDLPRQDGESGLAAYFASLLDPSLSWKDVEWLRSITRLPLWVKGLVRADDAVRAAEHGASGIVVSNHGGRQLDTSLPTIEALPNVTDALDAAGSNVEVMLDGGVRRGTDVLKALALGARAVMVGRPVLWGLAVDGEDGVAAVLDLLRREVNLALALAGCPTPAHVTRDLVRLAAVSSAS